jgi:hypothetical protein
MAAQWQTVGKDGRGARKESSKKRRKQDQGFKPIVIEPAEPLRESDTLFSAMNKKEVNDGAFSSEDESLPPPLHKPVPVKPSQRVKTVPKKVDRPDRREEQHIDELSPVDILRQLSAKEIDSCFDLAVSRHGGVQSSWLRDMSQYFQQKFAKGTRDAIDVSTEVWSNNLGDDVYRVLKKCYKLCQPESLEAFYASCVDSLSTEIHLNGHPGTYQLLIHTLQLFYPKLISNCAKQLDPILQGCVSRPNEALTLLKSLLPCPNCNDVQILAEGFDLYCQVLAPYYTRPSNVPKNVLKYSMTYLHQLCQSLLEVAKKQPLEEVAHFKDFVKFITAQVPRQLLGDSRAMVNRALESLLDVCIAHTHPIPRSSYFREGFVRLADQRGHEEDERLKKLVSGLAVVCEACRDEWMDLHEDHMKESLILLNELLLNSLKVKPLTPTLQQLRGSLTRSKDDKADVALCGRYIADLLDRCDGEGDAGDGDGEEGKEVKNRQSYQWTTALRKAFILFAFVIILDLGWSQGWEGSLTSTGLKAVGIHVPAISLDPLFSYITRMLRDIGASENLLNVWLTFVSALQTTWSLALKCLYLAGQMLKDLLYIMQHIVWDRLKQISIQDYINHFLHPLGRRT